jgi:hypothetical protein
LRRRGGSWSGGRESPSESGWCSAVWALSAGTYALSRSATVGSRSLPCLRVTWRTFWTTSEKGPRISSRWAPAGRWRQSSWWLGLSPRELLAVLTVGGTALEPGGGGLQLAIRDEPCACNAADCPAEAHQDGQGGLDSRCVHAAAAVAQIVRSRKGRGQAGQLALAAALLLLAQSCTEAGIVESRSTRLAHSRQKARAGS